MKSEEKAYFNLGGICHRLESSVQLTSAAAQLIKLHTKRDSVEPRHFNALLNSCQLSQRLLMNARFFYSDVLEHPFAYETDKQTIKELLRRLQKVASEFEHYKSHKSLEITVDIQSVESSTTESVSLIEFPPYFDQAVWNVIDNACSYSYSNSKIQILFRLLDDNFVVAIQNTGITMSSEDIENCTELFWRGKGGMHVYSSGIGIGLWVVKKILKYYEGNLSISSDNNITSFELSLPLLQTDGNAKRK